MSAASVGVYGVWAQEAPESVQRIIDTALALDDASDAGVKAQQQHKHLYEKATQSFKGSLLDLAKNYRQRRNDSVRFRYATGSQFFGQTAVSNKRYFLFSGVQTLC